MNIKFTARYNLCSVTHYTDTVSESKDFSRVTDVVVTDLGFASFIQFGVSHVSVYNTDFDATELSDDDLVTMWRDICLLAYDNADLYDLYAKKPIDSLYEIDFYLHQSGSINYRNFSALMGIMRFDCSRIDKAIDGKDRYTLKATQCALEIRERGL